MYWGRPPSLSISLISISRTVYKIGLGKDYSLKLTIFLHRLHIQVLTSLE